MRRIGLLSLVLALSLLALAASAGQGTVDPTRVTMEEFFQVQGFSGKSPRMVRFSESDRYLAFLWNPYDEQGYDLYIYDLKKKELQRVTSIERMREYDPPEDYEKFIKKMKQKKEEDRKTQEMYFAFRDYLEGKEVDLEKFEREELEELRRELEKEKLEKKKREEEKEVQEEEKGKKKEAEKELELWELRDKLREKKEKEKIKRGDLYPGVSRYVWSKKADELIFEYRGDLFRYVLASRRLRRITMTDEAESILAYTPDGKGYFYSRGNNVYRVRFGSSTIFQVNHKLWEENEFKTRRVSVSPNGQWMIVIGAKEKGKPAFKKVTLVDYKKRFAEAKPVNRQMPDDRRNEPTYRLFLRKVQETNYGREPEPMFEIPGGDVWYQFSRIHWSEDGSAYAFMTWEREKGDFKIWVGFTREGEKPQLLYETKEELGFWSFPFNHAVFTPDNAQLVVVLNNEHGFRQPVMFDLKTKEKRELIRGKFESFPVLGFTKDGRFMYVLSDKVDPAIHMVFRVSLETGEMTPVGKPDGMNRSPVVSHDGKWLATRWGNWARRPELFLLHVPSSSETMLTKSHREDWDRYNFIQPELFKYVNRHGDTISGMVFKPRGWSPEDRRPAIVYVYGGPLGERHTVELDNFSHQAYMFQMIMAAKHGFVTVNIDPRGQSGYGKKFHRANFEQVGKPQVEDLEDLVAYMGEALGVDTTRVGLHGWSFGGFQTLMTLLTSPDTFACGIAGAGPTEWENYNSWYSGSTIGPSVRGKPTLRKYSLLPLAKNLKKPLLLVHGMMDSNVLYQDTVHIYREFLRAGKETLVDLFLDPEGGHGLGGLIKSKAKYKKYETWFLEHLGKPGA